MSTLPKMPSTREQKLPFSAIKDMIDGFPDLIAALDTNYKYITFNPAYQQEFEKLYGTQIEVGTSLMDALAHMPKELTKAMDLWGRALKGESFSTTASISSSPPQQRQWFEISYTPIHDDQQRLMGACHIVRNITAAKQGQSTTKIVKMDNLNQTTQPFHFMALLNNDGTLLDVSQEGLNGFGLHKSDLIGHPLWECPWWEKTPQIVEELKLALSLARQGEWVQNVKSMVDENNLPFQAEFSLKAVATGSQQFPLFIAEGRATPLVRPVAPVAPVAPPPPVPPTSLDNPNITIGQNTDSRYQTILDAAQVGLWEWNLQETGESNWWNSTMYDILGLPPQSTNQSFETILQFLPPEDQAVVLSSLHNHLQTGEKFDVAFRFTPPSGQTRFLICTGKAMRDEAGVAIRMAGTMQDMTGQKQGELPLQDNTAKLRRLIDTPFIGVAFVRPNGNITDVNDSFLKLIGMERSHFENTPCNLRTLFSDNNREQVEQKWRQLFTQGECGTFEQKLVQSNGHVVHVMINAAMVFGNQPLAVFTLLDITEQKKREKQLWQKEQRLLTTLSASKMGTYCWGVQSNTMIWDDRLYPLFGLTPSASIENVEDFLNCIHPEDRERVQQTLQHCQNAATEFELEFRVCWPDNSEHWLFNHGRSFISNPDQNTVVMGACMDTTIRRRWESELQTAKKAAEEANRKKSQFIARMSHELRTPLNAVLGYASMLEKGIAGALNPKQLKYAYSIQSSGKHLLDMVNDLLDISKIEAGKFNLTLEQVDLDRLFTELSELLIPMAQQKAIALRFEKKADLRYIIADGTRLKQIFCNLISNGIKYNQPNGQVTINMSHSADGLWYQGEVTDTGIGIAPEHLENLFQEFYQVDSSAVSPSEGTGLGLALTRHLVEFHGGRIWVESQAGSGSVFRFTLPVSPWKEAIQDAAN